MNKPITPANADRTVQSRDHGPYPFSPPAPPSGEARERFARRRAAGRIAELLAQAVGRGCSEAGTAKVAIKLALESDALRQAKEQTGRHAGERGPGTTAQATRDDAGSARQQLVVRPAPARFAPQPDRLPAG